MNFKVQDGGRDLDVSVKRSDGRYVVTVDGVPHDVDAHKLEGDFFSLIVDGRSYEISVEWDGRGYAVRHGAAERRVSLADPGRRGRARRAGADGPAQVQAVMPGKVVRVLVNEGDEVKADQGLIVVEAMKMENEIASPKAGRVRTVHVEPGRTVEAGEALLLIE